MIYSSHAGRLIGPAKRIDDERTPNREVAIRVRQGASGSVIVEALDDNGRTTRIVITDPKVREILKGILVSPV